MKPKIFFLALFLIFCISFFLRFSLLIKNYCLTSYETYFPWKLHGSFSQVVDNIKHFCHHPLYFFLLDRTMHIFGDSDIAIKGLSVLFNLLLVVLIPLFAWVNPGLLDVKASLIGALMIAISPVHIFLSMYVTPYGLFMLLATVSNFTFMAFLESPSRRNTIWYVVTMMLTMYTHVVGLIVLFSHALFVFLRRKNAMRDFVYVAKILVIAYMPWGLLMLPHQFSEYRSAPGLWGLPGPLKYDPPLPNAQIVLEYFLEMISGSPFLLFLLLVLGLYGLWKAKGLRHWNELLVFWLLLPPLILFCLSYTIESFYKPKALLFITVPLFLLAANGLVLLRPPVRSAILILICFGLARPILKPSFFQPLEHWRELVHDIQEYPGKHSLLLHPVSASGVLRRYFPGKFISENKGEEAEAALGMETEKDTFICIIHWQSPQINKPFLEYLKSKYVLVEFKDYGCNSRFGDGLPLSYYIFRKHGF